MHVTDWDRRVQACDCRDELASKPAQVFTPGGSHDHRKLRWRSHDALGGGKVDVTFDAVCPFAPAPAGQGLVFHDIVNYAHDCAPLWLPRGLHPLSNRIFARPQHLRQGLAYQHYEWAVLIIELREGSAAQQWNLHGGDIQRANLKLPYLKRGISGELGPVFHCEGRDRQAG